MNLIIDNRMNPKIKEYLKSLGNIIEVENNNSLYPEISAHPDIFFSNILDKIICAPSLYEKYKDVLPELIKGGEDPKGTYPEDVLYNVCNIGKYVIGNFKYIDKVVLQEIENSNLEKIQVNQGYANCSICKVGENACITQDEGIYNELIKHNIDVLLIDNLDIYLLNNHDEKSKMKGFIGGATCIIDNTLIIFGDLNSFPSDVAKRITDFTSKYNVKIKDFKGLDVVDLGGAFFT